MLPPRSTPIPREKHIPTDKAQTRWEKFALEKGIKKKKRERMVWDEDKKEWRPRFGFKVQEMRILL
jgi:regulator of ribosome biosynthesis